MYQLIYASSSSVPFSSDELLELLKVSRSNNQKLNVTGLLLYRAGQFLQVLEGNREDVVSLYQKILLDKRHKDSRLLTEGEQAHRDFPDWSMGFRSFELSEESPPGFTNLLNSAPNQPMLAQHRAAARLLLGAFRTANCT